MSHYKAYTKVRRTEPDDIAIMLYAGILKLLGSNLYQDTGYSDSLILVSLSPSRRMTG
jgi:hypothetical protein